MTATSLHFGPEWMRNKQQTTPSATRPPASVLSPSVLQSTTSPASSYSSLLTPAAPAPPEKQDVANPFKYTKEDMLQVWKDGRGHGGLGLEVELWEGVVREIGGEPIGLKEMTEGERKLFSLPLNSELRRRQSHDFLPSLTLATGDRPKLAHSSSSTHSPLSQQRFSALTARRRKDDGIDSGQPLSLPRRLSLSSVSGPLGGPLSPTGGTLPSPRTRIGSGTYGLDGILSPGDGSWRKREADSAKPGSILGGGHGVQEQDEEAEGEGGKAPPIVDQNGSNGSLKDADTSGSTSGRSMAPSPPSVRGEPQRQEPVENTTSKLSRLALLDEQRKPGDAPDGLRNSVDTAGVPAASGISAARPPGVDEEPSTVSWSYRDPRGNIQGPFAATLMQKWYEEGYFTPDLLMKRTHLDTDWTPVGELSLRAGNEKLFFSSFADPTPPGLALRPTLPTADAQALDRFGQPLAQNMVHSQHQPSELLTTGSPLRHFRNSLTRTSTLDSYLSTSNSNQSDSPGSSFSAAIGPMPSASPDPGFGVGGLRSTFGNNGPEPGFGGRVGTFDVQPSSFGGRGGSNSFNAVNDQSYGPRLASLGHRGSMIENQGFTNLPNSGTPTSPWPSGISTSIPRNSEPTGLGNTPIHRGSLNNGVFNQPPVTSIPGFSDIGASDSTAFGSEAYNYANPSFSQPNRLPTTTDALTASFGPIGPSGGPLGIRPLQDLDSVPLHNRHAMDDLPRAHGSFSNGFGPNVSPMVQGQGSGFGISSNQGVQQQVPPHNVQQPSRHLPPISTFSQPAVSAAPAPASPQTIIQPQQQSFANLPVQSSWGVPEAVQPRPRPFDAPHPTSRNVVRTPITPAEATSYNRQQPSDWYNASKPEVDDGWGDISGSQSPAPSQGNDAAQAQQAGRNIPSQTSPAPPEQIQPPRSNPTPPDLQPSQPQPRESIAQKKRGPGPAAQASPLPVSKPSAAPVVTNPSPKPPSPLPVSTQIKPAWSTPAPGPEEETKTTKQAGLREIQEAEAKRIEARKVAEREKDRAARGQPQEETQTFTASWGLPTSQAGAARPTPKEQPPATPSPTTAPLVWTNAGKPPQAKRTLKEIQEEEERRRNAAAKEKETAAAAARRAYADSANKTAAGPPTGGAWTTVGSTGKSIAASSAPRPVSGTGPPTPSSQVGARTLNGSPATRAAPASPQNAKPSAMKPAAAADDSPVPPSPEFMKWLREAVRGFNPGFNTDEFITMLLTFSLDFPPSTVEVIQDMVYMNSATLDGRRFAADFCSKRKADAANRPKGWGSGASGKAPSLADVVKTQPKPVQSEIPFKMVKKKGVRR